MLNCITNFLKISFCSYKENAIRVQKAFKDRPLSPLDTAIFWTEYVIRHGGAPQMRSAAVGLAWYQYFLLDVIAVLFLTVVAVLLIFYVIVKKLVSLCRNVQTTKQKAKESWTNKCISFNTHFAIKAYLSWCILRVTHFVHTRWPPHVHLNEKEEPSLTMLLTFVCAAHREVANSLWRVVKQLYI